MSSNRPSDPTVAFYDANAEDFQERTMGLDMEALYAPFLERLEPGARILDAGCGPGRDVRAFAKRGYDVVGMDASGEMVRLARENTGQEIHHLRFEEIDWFETFDGVWACASLLHVPAEELTRVFRRLAASLQPGGILYVSFKYSDGERHDSERLFTNLSEAELARVVTAVSGIELVQTWRTQDLRPVQSREAWLNALLARVE